MAQLNTRGTMVRNRFDFYESSDCWGFVFGSVVSGPICAYLVNNASVAAQLDVYGVTWFSSTAQPWDVTVRAPSQTVTPIAPTESQLHSIQPDQPAPLGAVGLCSAFNPDVFYRLMRQSGGATSGSIDLGYGAAHTVLPPGWFLVISASVGAATELSATFFYQIVVDNVAPAH
jgi:hypothetical protein